jgi:hypothetical protein
MTPSQQDVGSLNSAGRLRGAQTLKYPREAVLRAIVLRLEIVDWEGRLQEKDAEKGATLKVSSPAGVEFSISRPVAPSGQAPT